MAIYYADLGKSGTGDGSFGNQYGKDQWDTINPAELGATALQIKGMATYTRDIKVCGPGTISKWPLITSQDTAIPFRINAPGHSVQFNQPSPQFFQGTDELSNAIIYCNDIALPPTHDCFFSVDSTWVFPGGLGGDVLKRCVVYSLAGYIAMTNPSGTIKDSLIYELATGYHLLKTEGILDTVLTNDTNFAGLTDGSWTDNGTTYNYTNHGETPASWDDANLYNFALGIKADVQNYVPSWVTFPVTPTTPRKGIHYAIEIFSNPLDSWSALTDSSVGVVNGIFRHVTDRPNYDGSTFIPTYGSDEIDVNGTSIAGNNTNIWKEGMIQKDGITSNPSREIDIVACGQYATDSSFSFKIRNDQLFWNYCAAAGIEFTGRRVVMWIVIDDCFYQCARGRVVNNPFTDTDYTFDIQDDSKLIHKMLPPLVTNPTNNPAIPDSDQGQPIPIVIGDVPKSKVLKLQSENIFIPLTNGGSLSCPASADAPGYLAYHVITETPTTGPMCSVQLLTIGVHFDAHALKGCYLQAIAGGGGTDIPKFNGDYIYRIIDNDASIESDTYTIVYLDSLLIADGDVIVQQSQFNNDLTTQRCAYDNQRTVTVPEHAQDTTWWFKISSFSIDTIVSNNPSPASAAVPQLNGNGVVDIYGFNSTTKLYTNLSTLVQVSSNGSLITLISNTASADGSVQALEDLGFPLIEFGVKSSDLNPMDIFGDYRTGRLEYSTDPAEIAKIQDRSRLTGHQFATTFTANPGPDASTYPLRVYAKFKLGKLAQDYQRIFFLCDLELTNATTQYLRLLSTRYFLFDIFGRLYSPYLFKSSQGVSSGSGANLLLKIADAYTVGTSPKELNQIPNNFYSLAKMGSDNQSLFLASGAAQTNSFGGNATLPVNFYSDFSKMSPGSKDDLGKTDFIKYIECHLGFLCYDAADSAILFTWSGLQIKLKQTTLMGMYQVPTISSDLYVRVKGELTGPQTTDPLHETNDVYHAFMHIMEDYDGIPKGLIDYGTGTPGDLAVTRSFWHVGRTLTERKNSIDYLNELCSHSFVGMFGGRTGKRCLRSFQADSISNPTVTHDKSLIVRDSIESAEKTDISQLFNSFFLQYSFDPALQQYVRAFIVSAIDQFTSFPAYNTKVGENAITPSTWATITALISANLFVYGNFFYTSDGTDTTDSALFDVKGSPLVAGDAFMVTGGSSVNYAGNGLIPLWYQCFGGLIGDISHPDKNYADSKDVWDRCRASYTTNQSVKQAQNDISQLPWFIDTMLFDPANLSGHGTSSSAFLLLQILSMWTTLQKYVYTYRIPINAATVETELLDYIYFKDKIYTNDQSVEGWIIHVEPDPSTDQLVIHTILKPTTIEGVNLIIERGPLLNADTITEGDHQTNTITETGV